MRERMKDEGREERGKRMEDGGWRTEDGGRRTEERKDER